MSESPSGPAPDLAELERIAELGGATAVGKAVTSPAGTTPEGTTPAVVTPEGTTPAVVTPEGTTPAGTTPAGTTAADVTQAGSRGRRWLARLAFAAVAAAALVLLLSGALTSITALLLGAAGVAVACAAAWWFVAHRGILRWLAALVLLASPAFVIAMYVIAGLLWEVMLSVALVLAATAAGRAALSGSRGPAGPWEYPAAPLRHPFLIMNPRSGGGKVGKFGLGENATGLGAEVAMLDGPGFADVAALARQAVDDGADLLGVAGGDGTQALVAGIAADRNLPMMVISAGTRNHFALDLGLDRDDPATCLEALTDAVELRIDLGLIGERTFVNNASFGAYAHVVQSPAYRDDKAGTALQMLPDLLSGAQGAHLTVRVDGQVIADGPQAVLVSNNPYETGDIAGLGRRARLDQGVLGVVCVKVESGVQAAGLLTRTQRSRCITACTVHEVTIDADQPSIPVGIDGESVLVPTPVRCTIRPLALRVRVPRSRPGVPRLRPPMDWTRLRHLALTVGRDSMPAAQGAQEGKRQGP